MSTYNVNPTTAITEEIRVQADKLKLRGIKVSWSQDWSTRTSGIHIKRRDGRERSFVEPELSLDRKWQARALALVKEVIEWITPIKPRPKAATRRHLQRRGPQRIAPN